MASAMVGAAFSVVGKALAPITDSLLKDWAASVQLGSNVQALELELLAVKALLEPTLGKEINSSSLKDLLVKLQDHAYDAEDVLDELDYFRIQDALDGTSHAADSHAKGGGAHNLALNIYHTAKAVGKQICCLPACFPWSSPPSVREDNISTEGINQTNEPLKLRFDRVGASKRMQLIAEQLRLVKQEVSSVITALGNLSTIPNIAPSRPITISESIEPKLYGRDDIMNRIIHDITKGKHSGEVLTVIPIFGQGGVGKTTLAQHIYHSRQVQEHFEVKVWTCVSLNFDVARLTEEIGKYIPKIDGETIGTARELIGQRLKNKRFLLVLDDIWDCSNEDDWKQLLIPFKKSEVRGNIIIVTTRFPAQAEKMVGKVGHSIPLLGLDPEALKELFLYFVFEGDEKSRKDHAFLLETGDNIVRRLKGSPLAAKTVGRLLRTQLDLVHWTRVLESKEWEQSDGKNDIMPALKLSYDYLPSRLQQCFSYFALFPQDYKFEREEIINFWIGLDVLHLSHYRNKRVEDIGLDYLRELVNHGFFETEEKKNGSSCYTMHDLLHDLARKVSSHECLSIDTSQSQVSSLQVLPSVRHLSINIDDTSVKDRLTFKNCVEDFNTLDKTLKVEKLRSLIIFGEHTGSFVKIFSGLFRKAKALRVVFLSGASYRVEDLLQNFYNLLHLRYLRIQGSFRFASKFPNELSRFYHMMVLDGKRCRMDDRDLPIDVSNLVKLRHFLVPKDAAHCSIAEVGKLKSLQELRRFVVKHEDQGFELREIGHLIELCGSLCLDQLENIKANEEADEAKLLKKNCLCELILRWNIDRSTNDYTLQEHVLERLEPSNNLLRLSIIGHSGAYCPSWLGMNLSVRSLESLRLDGVAWKTFPPIGELWLHNVPHGEISGNVPNKRFENLRRLALVNLPSLKKWDVHAPCQLFPFLEELEISGCSKLLELSFSHSACCQEEKEAYSNLFPRLLKLEIIKCPQLSSFPPFPWTEGPCSISVDEIGSSSVRLLRWGETQWFSYGSKAYSKIIFGNDSVSTVEEFNMQECQPLPPLRSLNPSFLSVTRADIRFRCASGKELTQLLTYSPKLSSLCLRDCVKITGLGVMGQHATATPGQPSSANNMQDARVYKEIAASDGLLLLPAQLKELRILDFPELSLHSNPLDNNKEDGRTGRGGLQGLSSLRRLEISGCPKLLASYSSSPFSSYFPFPNSLEYLWLEGKVGTEAPVHLSNLSSLSDFTLLDCDLRCEGLLSLITQGHLTKLNIRSTPNFLVGSEPSQLHHLDVPSRSSKLKGLWIDDVAGVTATPICSLLCSSLTELVFFSDLEVKRFTDEQETLLLANSLQDIRFVGCDSLQYLPARLDTLHNLKTLHLDFGNSQLRSLPDVLPSSLHNLRINGCHEILSLPDSLPSSLQELYIESCSEIRSLPDRLPSSLQKLEISSCPAIQSLPKVDDLPSSLREIDVRRSGSEELIRQCRELIGIIPIVET